MMQYEFPHIRNIDDVLPAISEASEFIVAERDGYSVVNYVVAKEDTFPVVNSLHSAIRRECRGLIFGPDGEILSRRFQKFFNVGERPETSTSVFSERESIQFEVLNKLDGSMVTPVRINGQIRWCSKMGVTHISDQVEAFVRENPQHNHYAAMSEYTGYTPIYEWCSPESRIVLGYDKPDLIMTAIRHNVTGEYIPYSMMKSICREQGIPCVEHHGVISSFQELLDLIASTKSMEGVEGFVLSDQYGHKVKIKADWYVLIHKTKDLLSHPRHVVSVYLSNMIDDVMPLFLEEDAIKAKKIIRLLNEDIADLTNIAINTANIFMGSDNPNKEFALSQKLLRVERLSGIIHTLLKTKNTEYNYVSKLVSDMVLKAASGNTRFDEFAAEMLPRISKEYGNG